MQVEISDQRILLLLIVKIDIVAYTFWLDIFGSHIITELNIEVI